MTRDEISAARRVLFAELESINEEGRALDEAVRRVESGVTPQEVLAELIERIRLHSERVLAHNDKMAIWAEAEKASRTKTD